MQPAREALTKSFRSYHTTQTGTLDPVVIKVATDAAEEWRRGRKVGKQPMASQKIRSDSRAWANDDAELLLTIMLKTWF